ncbi:MAG: lipid-A-disaccharide synthase-related protein [Prochlorothrix sp.]
MRLLCLSNGHGEDIIAVRILQALRAYPQVQDVAILPLVGEGHGYQAAGLSPDGPTQTMPSGGFIYMDGRQLLKDVKGGLVQLTFKQLGAIRQWAKGAKGTKKSENLILAVGDIVPLLMAWWSGMPYAFVGTAKSEYYLRDEVGLLPRQSRWEELESWSGSVYLPWERWLMRRSRCRAVFPRDGLTTEILAQKRIKAFSLGNPMMDGLALEPWPSLEGNPWQSCLRVLLLPGSRPPEAYSNWQLLLQAADSVISSYGGRKILFLGAISPGLDWEALFGALKRQGWRPQEQSQQSIVPGSHNFWRNNCGFQLSQSAYRDYLNLSDVAIAMAGTATEQFVGLGKPVLSIPGDGPQFTPEFAEAQTRLLGTAVTLVHSCSEVGPMMQRVLTDPDRLQLIAQMGYQRMGSPGAADRIAAKLVEVCSGL